MKIEYRKIQQYKYQLTNTATIFTPIKGQTVSHEYFALWETGQLFGFRTYCWDGSSWSLDNKSIRASLFHDIGYQMIRDGLLGMEYRETFDRLYRDVCIEDGLWEWHANLRYFMLRKFAKGAAKGKDKG